jgi:hypothetical protein
MKNSRRYQIINWVSCILIPVLIFGFLLFYFNGNSSESSFSRVSILYDYGASCIPYLILAVLTSLRFRRLKLLPLIDNEHLVFFDWFMSILTLSIFTIYIWASVYSGIDTESLLWGRAFALFITPLTGVILVLSVFHARLFLYFLRKIYFRRR